MIYKAIGMLSSLETIVHHMGADSAASALASLLSELQDLCTPTKHQQPAPMFPGVPAATQMAVPHAATAEPDAPPAPAATAQSDALKAVPRCTTCTDGVPVAGRFILRKVSLGEFVMPKRCRNCIDRGTRLPPGESAGRPLLLPSNPAAEQPPSLDRPPGLPPQEDKTAGAAEDVDEAAIPGISSWESGATKAEASIARSAAGHKPAGS